MQLSKLNLALTRIGKASFSPFSPKSLFSSGAQGAWYDPSDYSTMFEDAAGTIPITTPLEKPVGLMLDKSKGLVLGSEQVPATYSGTASGSWAVSTTSITRNGSATGQIALNLNTASDTSKRYQVVFTVSDLSGDTLGFRLGGGTAYNITANGTYTFRVVAGGIAGPIFIPWGGTAGQATITNISVRELPGNHCYQSTTTSRPTLSARVNLLEQTEAFDNSYWAKTGVGTLVANADTGADGTQTADVATANAALFRVSRNGITLSAGQHTFSIYLRRQSGSAQYEISIDGLTFTNITVTSTLTRFSLTATVAAGTAYTQIRARNATTSDTLTLWGADLRVANDGIGLPAYQRVNTATDYDYAGFPPYLKFDGTDDSMVTGNIDFTATDKMSVFAGVRKLSDGGVVAENTTGSGTVHMYAGDKATATGPAYTFVSVGTLSSGVDNSGYQAPITNVVTGLGNIAGDSAILRVNGTQVAADTTTDQGSGSYGNYPLYIGRRGGTTLPFNGRLYSLVVCGKTASASEITSTESYINQRTRAF